MLGSVGRVLLLAVLLSPVVVAQEAGSPVLVDRIDDGALVATVGSPARATFSLLNLDADEDQYVTFSVVAPERWSARAPDPFFLGPRQPANVTFEFVPVDTPRGTGRFEVVFEFRSALGGTARTSEIVEVGSGAPPRIVGDFENPLGPPLDNAYGTFLLDMLIWVGIGVVTVVLGGWLLQIILVRARSSTGREMVGKLRGPAFLFVLLLGLGQSFAKLPRTPFTEFVTKFLIAVAITVFGLYLLYRALEAALLYYQREIAPKTATKMDDVIVPAVRKVGLVVIYVVGIVMTLRNLGWDPTLIFAGAGIAGLVIAFAAQDTFSNLFSGVFLMLDRPFVEGDWITLESGDEAMVHDIGLRTTRLYNDKLNQMVIVPNNQLATRRIINHSAPDPRFRMQVEVAVTRNADPRKVEAILLRLASEHPECVIEGRFEPSVRFFGMNEGVLRFAIRLYVDGFHKRGRVTSDIRFAIAEAFKREGVEIAYPPREITVKQV